METERPTPDLPAEAEEKDVPSRAEKAFSIFSAVFFGLAVLVLLVMIYVNTAKNLTVSPYLSPVLYLLFGGGLGFGMLFRSIRRKKENVSLINYYFKVAFSVLILLSTLLSFLISLLDILG
ncbi:MAG: hypothetical protein J6P88_04540 [Clostridia bacterium]|nr:hypothetical protein [Clostridia bacterium]MBP5428466.1 hypothetical protein [Clostridia bacterium]